MLIKDKLLASVPNASKEELGDLEETLENLYKELKKDSKQTKRKTQREVNRDLLEVFLEMIVLASRQPTAGTLYARILRELNSFVHGVNDAQLSEIVSAPSDPAVLVKLLFARELVAHLATSKELTAEEADGWAKIQGLQAKEEILKAAGGTLTVSEVAELLGLTRQAVDKRRRNQSLLALAAGRRGFVYPRCQFTREGVLPGLPGYLQSIEASDWQKLIFLLEPNSQLSNMTPLEALRKSQIEKVKEAASRYGNQAA
jgi:hypothetical protein